MKNTDFYAYCRDRRKTAPDNSGIALCDVYNYMRECGVSKDGVRRFIQHRVNEEGNKGNRGLVDAFRWVQMLFDGPAMPDRTETRNTPLF